MNINTLRMGVIDSTHTFTTSLVPSEETWTYQELVYWNQLMYSQQH